MNLAGVQPGHRAAVPPSPEPVVARGHAVGRACHCPPQVPPHPSVVHGHEKPVWTSHLDHVGSCSGFRQPVPARQVERHP